MKVFQLSLDYLGQRNKSTSKKLKGLQEIFKGPKTANTIIIRNERNENRYSKQLLKIYENDLISKFFYFFTNLLDKKFKSELDIEIQLKKNS